MCQREHSGMVCPRNNYPTKRCLLYHFERGIESFASVRLIIESDQELLNSQIIPGVKLYSNGQRDQGNIMPACEILQDRPHALDIIIIRSG